MEGNFLIFFWFVTSFCAVGRADWSYSPIPMQRRMENDSSDSQSYNYAVSNSPAAEEQSNGHSDDDSKDAGDSGDSASKEEEEKEPAPFIWTDIKVPPSFLRLEYMTGYTFMGLMYGLGFLVFFQSLVVPVAKFLTAVVYIVFVTQGLMEPITLQDALQQVPPN